MRKLTGIKSFFMVLAATSALVGMLGITAFAATEPAKTTTEAPVTTSAPAAATATTPSATAISTTAPAAATTPSAVAIPAAATTPSATVIGAAEAKGTVKKIETVEKQVFVTINDGKEDRAYYTDAAGDSGKAVLQLKEGAVVIIKYALGTPVKYHDVMATPINNVPNAVTPEAATAPQKPVTAPTGISVMVNGSPVTFDVKPQIIKSSTMVPVRAILEKMGYALSFDAKTGVIKATEGKNEILMTIGSPVVKMGATTYNAPVAPMIIDGRTLIPLRALGEISGYAVKWDEAAQTASLTK